MPLQPLLKMFSGYDYEMDTGSPFRPLGRAGCFTAMYRCQPASALPSSNPLRHTLDFCGKSNNALVLPQSALEQLSNYNIEYPMIFQLTNSESGVFSHCGVLEFSAKEGVAYLPGWLMETLALAAGDFIQVANASLPSGKLIKIQPQSPDFLDITDPRAVLEFTLRQFTTLSPNDCFWINYADQIYKVKVLETEPDPRGILVIETDLNVDFAPPVGYKEPVPQTSAKASIASSLKDANGAFLMASHIQNSVSSVSSGGFVPFTGSGQSIRSASMGVAASTPTATTAPVLDPTKPAALNLPRNTMFFGVSPATKAPSDATKSTDKSTQPFKGASGSLR